MPKLSPTDAIDELQKDLKGTPSFLAGSLVAAYLYDLGPEAYQDVDVFTPSPIALVANVQQLLSKGYSIETRFERVWHRWLRYGLQGWHTNSIKLTSPLQTEVNLVFKKVNNQATTSLAQVIESFDFGLLGAGWDLETNTFRDMREYLFPQLTLGGPYPMMPNKRDNWRNGFISQYNGIREVGRYAKYYTYGHDMSAVKDDLVLGYRTAALYLSGRDKADKQALGQIYEVIARRIEDDEIAELLEASKEILYLDELDAIMDALE